MASFSINQTRTTEDQEIPVETRPAVASPQPQLTLAPGTHRFQLIVEDDLGRQSLPSVAAVTVLPAG